MATENTPPVPTRYSDEELQEFKDLILEKLAAAKAEYNQLRKTDNNDITDTSHSFNAMEEGATSLAKEEHGQLAQRLYKYIQNLEAALIRIENKTYGICKVTGKLIPKERLRVVPNATMTIEAK
ncbi:MAG: TraR/DksA family transcriptional regulator, partial [Bacteroidales bacterium]|nr:TraR/DksA family transcriptional regulator [Bacteroidales bacterium]